MSIGQIVGRAYLEAREQLKETLLAMITPGDMIIMLIALVFAAVGYCLQSAGLYSIAKRRRIYRPWRSWLPIGRSWIIGGISDDYVYVSKGKERDWDRLLVKLELASWGLGVAWLVVLEDIIMKMFTFEALESLAVTLQGNMKYYASKNDYSQYYEYQDLLETTLAMQKDQQQIFLYIALFALLVIVGLIVIQVFFYKAYYDLFASCRPDMKALFLVLSIVFPVTLPFFVFACRKQDLGLQEQPPEPRTPEPWETPKVFAGDS